MGFTDYKNASRFTDVMVVYHDTREFTERRFLMVEILYKGQQAWVSPMALSAVRGDSIAIFEFYCKCLRIYFIGIYSE